MRARVLIVSGLGLKDRVADEFQRANFELVYPPVEDSLEEAVVQLKPRLVIIEHSPPKLDGHQLCGQVRGITAVPVIVLGDSREAQEHARALAAGADFYLVQPCTPSQLVARSLALLRRSRDGTLK